MSNDDDPRAKHCRPGLPRGAPQPLLSRLDCADGGDVRAGAMHAAHAFAAHDASFRPADDDHDHDALDPYEWEQRHHAQTYKPRANDPYSFDAISGYAFHQTRGSSIQEIAANAAAGVEMDDGYMFKRAYYAADNPSHTITAETAAPNQHCPRNDDPSEHEHDDESRDAGDNSPVDIVAATVSTWDDPQLPCLTFRAFLLGTIFTILGAAVSQFYYFRANSLTFSIFFVQLVTYPLGLLLARILPTTRFNALGLARFSLNPGPFNRKEHMLIGVMASTGGTAAYAIDILAVNRLFYNREMAPFGAILLLLTTQMIGYGLAGFYSRFLVRPAAMIFPATLVQVALYNTLHGTEGPATSTSTNASKHASAVSAYAFNGAKSIATRFRFFLVALGSIFFYQLLPGYIAPILTSLSFVCWIWPRNGVAQLFGSGMHGLGMGAITLDWSAIGTFAPLYTPLWAQANFVAGVVAMMWIAAPLMWYFNVWDAWTFGLITPEQYDLEGDSYDIMRVLTPELELDPAKLNAYSPLRMSPHFALVYGTSFLALTATITHVFLYYRHSIGRQYRAARSERGGDIHTRLMRIYPQVPIMWYAGLFLAMLVLAIITCELFDVQLPWWGVIIAVLLSALLTFPIGVIQAISNNQIGLNVFSELVCGYMLPGRPLANVAFKVYGYMTMVQCLLLVTDMKLAHYMKVPPRKLFLVQLYGTVLGAMVNYGMMQWIFAAKMGVFVGDEVDPSGQWDPRNSRIFFAASIIWGALGPGRIFTSIDSPYTPLMWMFLVGLLLPVPFYLLHRRYPDSNWHLVNVPIFAIGTVAIPQSPANFITTLAIVSFMFQFYIYRYWHHWWRMYNYVLSAALDAGTQLSAVFVFVVFGTLFGNIRFPHWIGNATPSAEYCIVDLSRGGPFE